MPLGYNFNPVLQMKVEDERAGRLDYVYETSLTVSQCQEKLGKRVSGKLSEYETEVRDGTLYISFIDRAEDTGGLFVSPNHEYAVRFESMGDKTIIRARYNWEVNVMNVQYLMRADIDAFFCDLFEATVVENDTKVWTDSAEEESKKDPLMIHGSKSFWMINAIFVLLWLGFFVIMGMTQGFGF